MELQSRFARTRDARKSAIIRQEWIQTQRKTFTNWMNAKLSETGYNVKSLETDLIDGVALIKLMEVLSHGKKVGRLVSSFIKLHEINPLAWYRVYCSSTPCSILLNSLALYVANPSSFDAVPTFNVNLF